MLKWEVAEVTLAIASKRELWRFGPAILVPDKKYSEVGVRKIYGKKSSRITNSPLVFPDPCCLGQVQSWGMKFYCNSETNRE